MPDDKSASPALGRGFVRLGVLMSVLWMLGVGGVAMQEQQAGAGDQVCAVTPNMGGCHRYFWSWELSDDVRDDLNAIGKESPDQLQKRFSLGNMLNKYGNGTKPAAQHLKTGFLAEVLFGPLVLAWGLGFGVAWCLMGFKPHKK